jgi:hypothetical protein
LPDSSASQQDVLGRVGGRRLKKLAIVRRSTVSAAVAPCFSFVLIYYKLKSKMFLWPFISFENQLEASESQFFLFNPDFSAFLPCLFVYPLPICRKFVNNAVSNQAWLEIEA